MVMKKGAKKIGNIVTESSGIREKTKTLRRVPMSVARVAAPTPPTTHGLSRDPAPANTKMYGSSPQATRKSRLRHVVPGSTLVAQTSTIPQPDSASPTFLVIRRHYNRLHVFSSDGLVCPRVARGIRPNGARAGIGRVRHHHGLPAVDRP